MPTYEYACRSCGTHVEVYQRFSDPPLADCGVCGGPLRKVFHPAGILFKGTGFYATDSRRSGTPAGAGKAEAGGTAKGDEAGKAEPVKPAQGPGKPSAAASKKESA